MEAEYYTPDLSEFHIGFAFEAKELDSDKWFRITFTSFQSLNHIHGLIEAGCVRVKRLDADDIVECGWNFDGETKDGSDFFFGNWSDWMLTTKDFVTVKIFPASGNNKGGCFTGALKNKSDLRDQMKRCGIEVK